MGLFLGLDEDWVEPEIVGPGCAVLLKSESREQWWRVLDDGEEPRSDYEVPPSDDLAQRLLGRRTGEAVALREDGLEDLSYEVAAVKSKFARAAQETMEEFSTRFPRHMGLSRVAADDDGMVKVFTNVDQRDQFAREVEQAYREGRLPFALFSSRLQRSVIEVWHAYAGTSLSRIHFGTGTEEEATQASQLLRDADGVVLDLLALLTVHDLGLATPLHSRYGRVAVPQRVIDELQEVYFNEIVVGSASAGYLGKTSGGQYTMTQVSEQERTRQTEFVRSVLEFAESFERIPSYRLLDAGDVEPFVNVLTWASVGAVCSGDEQPARGLTLLCDDLGLANLARSLGVGAVNTQAILDDLRRAEAVTEEEYSLSVERLAVLNYRFVRVRPEDIIRRLEASVYTTSEGTQAMLRTLEGPDCSEDWAISVASRVIVLLAGKIPTEQLGWILVRMLTTLRNGREGSSVLFRFRDSIASGLALVAGPLTRARLLQIADDHIPILAGSPGTRLV